MGWLCWLPASMGILMTVTIVMAYVIAVVRDDVGAIWPYISDTGAKIPESCIFSQLLNICAAVGLVTMYLRYRLVLAITRAEGKHLRRIATTCLVLAFLCCIGLSMVGNFQENEIEQAHITGAALVFGGGTVYAILDTTASFLMYPRFNGLYICCVRLAVCVTLFVSFVTATTGKYVSQSRKPASLDGMHWKPTDPGYAEHLIGTFGEWAMAACYLLYFFTFIRDFQKFDARVEVDLHVVHLDQGPSVAPADLTKTGHRRQPNEKTKLLAHASV